MTYWLLHTLPGDAAPHSAEAATCLVFPALRGVGDARNLGHWEIKPLLREAYGELTPEALDRLHTQFWAFIDQILPEDIVVWVEGAQVRLAQVQGGYVFQPGVSGDGANDSAGYHTRLVEWLAEPMTLDAFTAHTGVELPVAPLAGNADDSAHIAAIAALTLRSLEDATLVETIRHRFRLEGAGRVPWRYIVMAVLLLEFIIFFMVYGFRH